MALAFVKMHGLGNDFVVVDRRGAGSPVPPAQAKELCERHRGIGGDGVLSILPSTRAPLAMHVTNTDGSIAEMCGNGLRCVVRYAVDRRLLDPTGLIETGRGVLSYAVEADGHIRIDMGAAVLDPPSIPVLLPGDRVVSTPIHVGDERVTITAVSMGNPHAIVFVEPGQNPQEWAQRLGPAMERHPLFPHRTNAEFALITGPSTIDLVVWERGAGFTQACGTGACATAVAAVLTGRVHPDSSIRIMLPGGPLRVSVQADLAHVWMTGPAVEVFSGSVE